MPAFEDVLKFWFEDITPAQKWTKDPQFDQLIREKFLDVHSMSMAGELFSWRTSPLGRLAEIIVLDQFSRNMFRDTPAAFASDALALCLAQEAVLHHIDKEIPQDKLSFLYMPYMHSESKIVHQEALRLFSQPGFEGNLKYEQDHKAVIDRFGRYPHRNKILGRESTAEELAYLKDNSGW